MKTNDRINAIWNSNDHAIWLNAESEYYKIDSVSKNLQIEKEMEDLLSSKVEAYSDEEFYYFLYEKYLVWKYTATNRLTTVRNNFLYYNQNLQELSLIKQALFSFDTSNVQLGLKIALLIKGLGCAGASGLLSILFPDDYGTVDQFVVKALQKCDEFTGKADVHVIKPESINLKQTVILEEILKRKAQKLNDENNTIYWTPRRIDKVLWSFGRN